MTADFQNPSFELPAADGRPGEALGWTWAAVQQSAAFADFNAGLPLYARATESFEAGWPDNEDWLDGYGALDLTRATFLPEAALAESFEWFAWEEEITAFAAGLSGWWDRQYHPGAPLYPLGVEGFEEAWDNDPWGASGWVPGTARNGRMYGAPVRLPVVIPTGRDRLWVWHRGHVAADKLLELDLAPGIYTTATALAAAVQVAWDAAVEAACGLTWTATEVGGYATLSGGWDGVSPDSEDLFLLAPEALAARDARALLGLDAVGPLAGPGVFMPTEALGEPAGDRAWADAFALLRYAVVGGKVAEYGAVFALFDAGATEEAFLLTGWAGSGAVWVDHYDPSDLTAAVFDAALVPEPYEDFDEGWSAEQLRF
jgi:hypothetical protein